MVRKILLCIFALAQLLCANLRIDYTVSVGGQELPGTFTGAQLKRCSQVSAAAVEEIARGHSQPAEYAASPRLTYLYADGDSRALNDALITGADDVSRGCAVYVAGKFVGTVSDPELIQNSLHNYFELTGNGSLILKPVYSSAGNFNNSETLACCQLSLHNFYG